MAAAPTCSSLLIDRKVVVVKARYRGAPGLTLAAFAWVLVGCSAPGSAETEGTVSSSEEISSSLTLHMTPELDRLVGHISGWSEGYFVYQDDESYGYFNKDGDLIAGGFDLATPFKDGVALVAFTDAADPARAVSRTLNGRELGQVEFGLLNVDGELLGGSRFEMVKGLSEGLIPVQRAGKWGYLDKEGNFAIAPQFDFADPFREGRAVVHTGDSFAIISRDGEVISEIETGRPGLFSDGLLHIDNGNPESVVYDLSGREVLRVGLGEHFPNSTPGLRNYAISSDFNSGLALARNIDAGTSGYLDIEGNFLMQSAGGEYREFRNGLAPMRPDSGPYSGTWIFINSEGEPAFSDPNGVSFDRVREQFLNPRSVLDFFRRDAADDYWIVSRDGKHGAVTASGDLILPVYDQVMGIGAGLFAVTQNGMSSIIDAKGNVLVEPSRFRVVTSFSAGRVWVEIDGRLGYFGAS